MLTSEDDGLRQAAAAAWNTRLAAPVARLLDDDLRAEGPGSARWLCFDGPDGRLLVRLEVGAHGRVSLRVEAPTGAVAVELWGPEGQVAALRSKDGVWSANVEVTGPVRLLFMGPDVTSPPVRLQTEWFAVP